MKHFDNIKTLEELKKAYKELVKKFHPDINKAKGVDTTGVMQEINAEYEQLEKRLKSGFTGAQKEKADNINDTYRDIINKIINLNIDIEICGWWVWVTGNTYSVKNELKEAGFKWAGKKKAWYWYPEGAEAVSRKNYSMDEIRQIHGSEVVKTSNKLKEIAG